MRTKLIVVIVLMLISSISVYAEDGNGWNDNGTQSGTRIKYASYENTIPTVTIDDLVNWANRKGFEVIHFLQSLFYPFAIIIFIVSAFLTLLGSISSGDMAGRGLMGMISASVLYAVVLYSPLIMQTFVGWVAS